MIRGFGPALALALSTCAGALACSCFPAEFAAELETTDAVFRARVQAIDLVDVSLAVAEVFKGEVDEIVVMRTTNGCCYCAYWFEDDTEYLIWAQGAEQEWHTSTCTRTRPTAFPEAQADLESLRNSSTEGYPPGDRDP